MSTTFEPKKIQEERFEFLFYINNHIICQRYFNMYNFNEDVIKSLELKELSDTIAGVNNGDWGDLGIIPKYLKKRAINYLWDNYKPYYGQQDEQNRADKVDNFQFEIKVDKNSVLKTEFSGNLFPPKVRYDVNIKELIPDILSEIKYVFSQSDYTLMEN